jgi:hypothetical protein
MGVHLRIEERGPWKVLSPRLFLNLGEVFIDMSFIKDAGGGGMKGERNDH